MGTERGPYNAEHARGAAVRIRSADELRAFQRSWKFHDPLQDDQLEYAGRTAIVEDVGFYHGGDELYVLSGVPGVWHAQCLVAA